MSSNNGRWALGVGVLVAGLLSLPRLADADGQREGVARVIVEGVVIGLKHTGSKWEKWDNGGKLNPDDIKALTAATADVAQLSGEPNAIVWTKLADVVAGIMSRASAKTDPPDPRGIATLIVGGDQVGAPVEIPIAHDTYTPDWSDFMDWRHVPLNQDVRIRIQLWDSDDAKKPARDDRIGTVVITSNDLKNAARDGHVYSVYTGGQSGDQIVAVKVTVMLEAYATNATDAAQSEEAVTRRFLEFLEALATAVVSDKNKCDDMARDVVALMDSNAALVADVKRVWPDGKKPPQSMTDAINSSLERMKPSIATCANNAKVKAAFEHFK